MLQSLLAKVPDVNGYAEVAPIADALTSSFTIPGSLIAKTADVAFVLGEDGVWEIPLAGISAAREVEKAPIAASGSATPVELSIKHGTKVVLRQQYEVGVTLVPSSASSLPDPTSGGCGCSGAESLTSVQAAACPPGCWPCPNGSCCCPPMTRCLRVGCAR